jgi:hypothetical protein
MSVKRLSIASLVACLLVLMPRMALAHAHLVSSTPAANAAVHGPSVSIDLNFNSRVDIKGCMIELVMPNGQARKLALDRQSTETSLDAHTILQPGRYTIRWQALSTDGHITRGEVPFSVR